MRLFDQGFDRLNHQLRAGLGVEGGLNSEAAALEDVGVDHGGFHVFVAEQFLDGTDIVTCL